MFIQQLLRMPTSGLGQNMPFHTYKPCIVWNVCCGCRVRGHDNGIRWPCLLAIMLLLLFLFLSR